MDSFSGNTSHKFSWLPVLISKRRLSVKASSRHDCSYSQTRLSFPIYTPVVITLHCCLGATNFEILSVAQDMVYRQLQTKEPFLHLPGAHEHVIITHRRMNNAPPVTPSLNDPPTSKWLSSPPYPYHLKRAISWSGSYDKVANDELHNLEAAGKQDPDGPLKVVESSPVTILNRMVSNGTEMFLEEDVIFATSW